MAARETAAGSIGFDPRRVLRHARRGRSRAEKFDAFSDVYIWVIIVVFALAYSFGFLRAGLGALLGEFATPVALPSAFLPLSEVLLAAVLVIPALVLHLLLWVGPAAVTGAQGLWWLPLPIEQDGLRRGARRKAALIGITGCVSGWILWFSLAAAVLPSPSWLMSLSGLLTALVAGAVLADTALLIQHRAAGRLAHRLPALVLYLLGIWYAAQWVLQAVGALGPGQDALEGLFWQPAVFVGVLGLCLVAMACLRSTARQAAQQLAPKVLRAAGHRQHTVHAALHVMDAGALATVAEPRAIRRVPAPHRSRGGMLPVAIEIVVKRVLRRGLHRRMLMSQGVCTALLLLVQDAANPVALSLMMLVLLVQLMLAMSTGFEPLLAGGTWSRILGIGWCQISTGLVWAVLLPALLIAGLAALAGQLFFVVGDPWALLVAVLLAATGVVAGVSQRAGRGHQDLDAALRGIGTTAGALISVSHVISGVLPTMLAALPLLVVLLAGTSGVPWIVWGIAVVAGSPGIKAMVPGRAR